MLFLQKSSINAKFILGGLPPITKLKNWGKKPLVLAYGKAFRLGKKKIPKGLYFC
jgi:hypothetical protein